MPDPYGPDMGQEWIELYNDTFEPVDLTGWVLKDCGSQKWAINGKDLVIEPGGFLVLGANANTTTNDGPYSVFLFY